LVGLGFLNIFFLDKRGFPPGSIDHATKSNSIQDPVTNTGTPKLKPEPSNNQDRKTNTQTTGRGTESIHILPQSLSSTSNPQELTTPFFQK
jgi:hypothetical protein